MAERKLKTIVTAETSDFKKGMRESRKVLADFQKQGQQSLSDIASMFGVSSGAVGTLSRDISNAATLFKNFGRSGVTATEGIRVAMSTLATSIAGLGIGAAILAFKELNAEASNFEQRLQGVNLAASAKAARDTYRQSLYDSAGVGEGWANFTENVKTRLSMGWSNLVAGLGSATDADREKAIRAAKRAGKLASERVDLNRELDASLVTQAQYQKEINEQLLIARNRSASKSERDAAQAKAVELINQKYDQQLDIATRILANQEEMNSLAGNTDAETRETYQAQANVLNIEAQRQQELTSMVRLENQITGTKTSQAKAAKETQEATALTLAAATELVTKGRELAELTKQNNLAKAAARFRMDGALPTLSQTPKEVEVWNKEKKKWETKATDIWNAQAKALEVPALIKPVVDTGAAQAAIVELSGVIESGVAGMSEAIGTLIGDLINGENAWGNFAQAGISVVADMLSTVGKAFITEGVGVIAAKAALTSGNGVAAIAAGSAMVALAATMKTAMSNAAANWGGSSGSVATSSYSSGTSSGVTAFGREMNIKVSGTLTANGSKLVAVLNNENDRRNYTT